MRILICEDDLISQDVLIRQLSGVGVINTANDGKEAIESFKKAWEEGEPYAIICLDVMMPKISGHEVLKLVREFEAQRGIDAEHAAKVIMTTALKDKDNFIKAHQAGSHWYLTKPISKKELLDTLEDLGVLNQQS